MNSRIADGSRHSIGISFAIAAPDLGLLLRPVSREIALALDIRQGGILVDRVNPGSIADRAGLVAGDVIAAADDRPLTGPGDLAFAVDAALPAGRLSLTLHRTGAPVASTMTFDPPETTLALRDPGSAQARIAAWRLDQPGVNAIKEILVVAVEATDTGPRADLARLATPDRLRGSAARVPPETDAIEALLDPDHVARGFTARRPPLSFLRQTLRVLAPGTPPR